MRFGGQSSYYLLSSLYSWDVVIILWWREGNNLSCIFIWMKNELSKFYIYKTNFVMHSTTYNECRSIRHSNVRHSKNSYAANSLTCLKPCCHRIILSIRSVSSIFHRLHLILHLFDSKKSIQFIVQVSDWSIMVSIYCKRAIIEFMSLSE